MSPRNTAKADIVLKNFWKDNAHFADLSMQSCLTGNKSCTRKISGKLM